MTHARTHPSSVRVTGAISLLALIAVAVALPPKDALVGFTREQIVHGMLVATFLLFALFEGIDGRDAPAAGYALVALAFAIGGIRPISDLLALGVAAVFLVIGGAFVIAGPITSE